MPVAFKEQMTEALEHLRRFAAMPKGGNEINQRVVRRWCVSGSVHSGMENRRVEVDFTPVLDALATWL